MPGTAIARPDWTPGGSMQDFTAWLDRQRAANPGYQSPAGYEWKDDHYERDTHGLASDILKWTALLGGFGAMAYGGAAGLGYAPTAATTAPAAGASAATAGTAAPFAGTYGGYMAPAATTVGGGTAAGATAAGTAAGAGTMANMNTWLQLAPYVTAGISALRGRGGNDQSEALASQQQQLIDLQTRRLQQSDPLYQAILKLAMGLMPTSARGQMTQPGTAQPRRGY